MGPNSASDKVVFESVTVTGLSPFTNYTCRAFTFNTGGFSNKSKEVDVTTLEDGKTALFSFCTNILI